MMDYKSSSCHKLFTLILISVCGTVRSRTIQETTINTRLGSLTGKIEQVEFDGEVKNVSSFLGIPYAKPPLCERRFSRPERYGDLKGSPRYNATFYRPHCIQVRSAYIYINSFKQSEDCLFLNIFVPATSANESFFFHHFHNPYPVMIYIHGGSFAVGGADVYAGDRLSAFNDVIVVTINYRLNVFGFLSDGGKYSGNYGLWDMKLAIQWVHDNIQDYGGDPTRVTLFGNSAGGAAVLYQAIHPDNRGLFQRIIPQSGSCFAFWALQDNPVVYFNWYTGTIGCTRGNYTEILNCLRKMPIDSLTLGYSNYATKFVPAVDGDFLLEKPASLAERQSAAGRDAMAFFSEVDLLSGVLSQDGAYARGRWVYRMSKLNINGVSKSYFVDRFIPMMLERMYNRTLPVLSKAVLHQYTDWSRPVDTRRIRNKLIDFESDVTFFVPALHALKKHVEKSQSNSSMKNNSYFYVFDHKPDFAPEPKWLTGATHVMELPYVFGFTKAMEIKLQKDYGAVDPLITSAEDIKFSKEMMRFWTNFAKTGNPNIAEEDSGFIFKWPPYSLDSQLYLELKPNMTSQSVKHHFVASREAFWEEVVPMLKDCDSNSGSSHFCTSVVCLTECMVLCIFMVLDSFVNI